MLVRGGYAVTVAGVVPLNGQRHRTMALDGDAWLMNAHADSNVESPVACLIKLALVALDRNTSLAPPKLR